MGNVQIECTKVDVYWMHCQICGIDGPRAEADRQHTEHHRLHAERPEWRDGIPAAPPADSTPGTVQVDDSGLEVLVHVVAPREWFTLAQLRQWAGYLAVVADENEPAPEIDEMAGILETAAALSNPSPRAMARTLHNSGYRLERASA